MEKVLKKFHVQKIQIFFSGSKRDYTKYIDYFSDSVGDDDGIDKSPTFQDEMKNKVKNLLMIDGVKRISIKNNGPSLFEIIIATQNRDYQAISDKIYKACGGYSISIVSDMLSLHSSGENERKINLIIRDYKF